MEHEPEKAPFFNKPHKKETWGYDRMANHDASLEVTRKKSELYVIQKGKASHMNSPVRSPKKVGEPSKFPPISKISNSSFGMIASNMARDYAKRSDSGSRLVDSMRSSYQA